MNNKQWKNTIIRQHYSHHARLSLPKIISNLPLYKKILTILIVYYHHLRRHYHHHHHCHMPTTSLKPPTSSPPPPPLPHPFAIFTPTNTDVFNIFQKCHHTSNQAPSLTPPVPPSLPPPAPAPPIPDTRDIHFPPNWWRQKYGEISDDNPLDTSDVICL